MWNAESELLDNFRVAEDFHVKASFHLVNTVLKDRTSNNHVKLLQLKLLMRSQLMSNLQLKRFANRWHYLAMLTVMLLTQRSIYSSDALNAQ